MRLTVLFWLCLETTQAIAAASLPVRVLTVQVPARAAAGERRHPAVALAGRTAAGINSAH